MVSIAVAIPCFISGLPRTPGDSITVPLATAYDYVAQRFAYWPGFSGGLKSLPNVNGEAFLDLVTSTDTTPTTGLGSYASGGIPTGRLFEAVIGSTKKYFQIQDATALTADGVAVISPPDFDATDNNRFLVQIF